MIELASETDFVAKNEQFQTLAGDIVAHFANATATDVASLLAETLKDGKHGRREHRRPCRGDRREARTAPRGEARRAGGDLPAPQGLRPAAAGRRARPVLRRRPRPPAAPQCRSRRCGPATSPATTCRPTRSTPSGALLEEKTRDEGKPEAALPRSSRAASTAFFKSTTSCSSRSRSRTPRRRSSSARRGRRDGDAVRALRGRAGLSPPGRAGSAAETSTGAVQRERRPPMTDDSAAAASSAGRSSFASAPPYRRVLLKLSGEVFGGGSIGVDPDVAHSLAQQIAEVVRGWHPGGRRRRRRQLLPRLRAVTSGAWTATAPTTWACSAQ